MEVVTDGDADLIAARVWGRGTPRTPQHADAGQGSRGLTPAMLSDPRVMGALRLAQREGVSMDVAMRLLAAASSDDGDGTTSQAHGAGAHGPNGTATTSNMTPSASDAEPRVEQGEVGQTRHRSPSVQAIVPVRHGRRVKVVTVRTEELWALPSVRGRLAGLGLLAVMARRARRRSVAAALLGLGMVARVCRQSREARVAAKVLALGVVAGSRRRRVVGSLSVRLFAVGLPLLEQRWDASARAAAAEAEQRKAQKQAAKLARAESAKVRQVRWGVLTQADVAEGSMWARQGGEGAGEQESGQAAASDVDDLMGRVKLAFAKAAPAQGRSGGADSKPSKAKPAKPAKVSLIADAKAQRALGIGIAGAVRGTTLDELGNGIAQLDADALGGLDAAEALLGMMEEVPAEAEAAVRGFQGDPATLDLPEQFILRCVVGVPRAKERLALATAQASLSDSMRIVRQRSELVEKACAEVRGSWRFRFLLRDVVVPIGNQLNAGTKLGQAAGVRIDTLSSLVQTRTADNRTFLRFIVEGLVESDDGADLLHVVDDFPTITGTAPAFFAWDALTSETAALRKGSALASKVLVIPEVEADAELLGRVQAMACDADAAAASAAEAFAGCRASFDGICEFLGVPQGEMPPDKLFPHIATFIELVAKDTNFVVARRERQRKARAQAEEKASREQATARRASLLSDTASARLPHRQGSSAPSDGAFSDRIASSIRSSIQRNMRQSVVALSALSAFGTSESVQGLLLPEDAVAAESGGE